MEHIKYQSIEQFRHVVAAVNRSYNFIGMNEETNEPMYDPSMKKPTLKFTGTVKIHGTNAGVSYNSKDGLWAQARKHNITVEKDNAGFAFFVESKKTIFMSIVFDVAKENKIDLSKQTITIYGEWAGKGIQKGIAISELPKSFYIFGIKISEEDKDNYWISHAKYCNTENLIFNVSQFKTFDIDVDFEHPEIAQNKIIDMTISVEDECPIASKFGVKGIGEGIVFKHKSDKYDLTFKSKGEKHSKSKVKTIKEVDITKVNKINEIAEKVTPKWRLEQMLEETFDLNNGGELTRKKLGEYLKSVVNDVIKEDLDIIIGAGLEPKDVNKNISVIARNYFFEEEKKFIGI